MRILSIIIVLVITPLLVLKEYSLSSATVVTEISNETTKSSVDSDELEKEVQTFVTNWRSTIHKWSETNLGIVIPAESKREFDAHNGSVDIPPEHLPVLI